MNFLFKSIYYLLYKMLRNHQTLEELQAELQALDLDPKDRAEVETFIKNISQLQDLKTRYDRVEQIERDLKKKPKKKP